MHRIELTQRAYNVIQPAIEGFETDVLTEYRLGQLRAYQTENMRIAMLVREEASEFAIIALGGSGLFNVRNEILDFARENRFRTIRFHTRNSDVVRAVAGLGFVRVGQDENGFNVYRSALQ